MVLLGSAFTAQAQHQLKNAGFEEWEDVSFSNKSGQEPVNWNSFLTGTGSLKNTAATNQLEKSTEVRPGSIGAYSAKLFDRKVFLTTYAQGNLTTGCINMGSVSANDAKGNYNYTNADDDDFNQKFSGRPDAMHVWIKYMSTNASFRAKANTILHTEGYYQDPEANTITATVVAKAEKMDIVSSNDWQELTIPFVYTGTAEVPSYALVSFATNITPGKGTGKDYMLVDDLEYLYYSQLASLSYNGIPVADFDKDVYAYTIAGNYTDGCLEAVKNCAGGTCTVGAYDEETKTVTITVKGDDWSEANKNEHSYVITFVEPQPEVTEYTSMLTVGVNGETTEPQETTIQLIKEADGSYTFALNNFMMGSGDEAMPVGNIRLNNLTVSGNDVFTANQTIQIAPGTQEDKEWMGPLLGDVPVVLTAVREGDNLTADIDIDMSESLEQVIKVIFAPSVTLTDAEAPAFAGLKNVTLQRTFKAGWNTICLPFDYSVNTFGEGATAQTFASASEAGLVFEAVEDMKANVPYLLYLPAEMETPLYFGVNVASATPVAVTYGEFTFTGTYEPISMAGKYGVASVDGADKIVKGGANATVKGTRAYFTSTNADVKEMPLLIDGVATVVTGVQAAERSIYDVYTLTGVQVRKGAATLNGLRKGIYIVNGKKMNVK